MGVDKERFIPARAGNTSAATRVIPLQPVHPRPCGEHSLNGIVPVRTAGSSPPVRGTHSCSAGIFRAPRFIPARAGNTVRGLGAPGTAPVHPRPCGEHLERGPGLIPASGSSPPVRNTSWPPPSVHPRPCGEHVRDRHADQFRRGSSPPVRGTPWARHGRAEVGRFIPARAGNTPDSGGCTVIATVHPRPCGEHPYPSPHHLRRGGSSPPVRGTQRSAACV